MTETTTTTEQCNGHIIYVDDITRETAAEVTEDGHISIDHAGWNVLDTHEVSLWCSDCGRLGDDEYEAHGISEYWEVF